MAVLAQVKKRNSKKKPAEPDPEVAPNLPRDFETGKLLVPSPNHRPAGPIAAEGTPFARLRNSLHRFVLVGSDGLDATAQEVARAIEEALPIALGIWPEKERLLPLQQLQSYFAELRYHSDWKKALKLVEAVREVLPELIDRARIAEVAAQSSAANRKVETNAVFPGDNPNLHARSDHANETQHETPGQTPRGDAWSPSAHQALVLTLLQRDGRLRTGDLWKRISPKHIDQRAHQNAMRDLVLRGKVLRDGKGRATEYWLP